MAPGKNKLERGIRIQIDDSGGTPRELGGDLVPGSINGLGFTASEVDMTGVSDPVENVMADRKQNTLTMQFYMNDTATTGATTVLNGIVGMNGITVTVQVGAAGAAPTSGDPEFSGEFACMGAAVNNSGGKLVHEVTFRPYGATPPAWGTVD